MAVRAAAALVVAASAGAVPAGAQLRDGFRATLAPGGDDTVTPFVPFGFTLHLRGGQYDAGSACMNGWVSLLLPFDGQSCPYPGQTTVLGSLAGFADVHGVAVVGFARDLRSDAPASGQLGYGTGLVEGRRAFGFTWDGVFDWSGDVDTPTPNVFQILFVDRSADFAAGDFDVEYNYGLLQGTPAATIAGLADDGGLSGVPYAAPVTPTADGRVVQAVRGGSVVATTVNVVPEPSTHALAVSGAGALAAVAGLRRRRPA